MTASTAVANLQGFGECSWAASRSFIVAVITFPYDGILMFNYDWFHGPGFQQQKDEARWRCSLQHFPDVDPEKARDNAELMKFHSELEQRTLIYLRDGFSYEVKHISDIGSKSDLVFECVPVDEQYKVGTFMVTVPFEEIGRVEVFAVHPREKPDDLPQITGFRAGAEPGEYKHGEAKPPKMPTPGR